MKSYMASLDWGAYKFPYVDNFGLIGGIGAMIRSYGNIVLVPEDAGRTKRDNTKKRGANNNMTRKGGTAPASRQ